jgi:hypothetical protein
MLARVHCWRFSAQFTDPRSIDIRTSVSARTQLTAALDFEWSCGIALWTRAVPSSVERARP